MADPTASAVNFIQNRLYLPAPAMFGAFVTGLESVGGILLALGLATRLVAPMVGIEMATICFILGPTWVWLERGIEYPLLMGFLALFIYLRGGGTVFTGPSNRQGDLTARWSAPLGVDRIKPLF